MIKKGEMRNQRWLVRAISFYIQSVTSKIEVADYKTNCGRRINRGLKIEVAG